MAYSRCFVAYLVFDTVSGLFTRGANERAVEEASFIKQIDAVHKLRVCNAYPYDAAMDVFDGKKLNSKPIAYKRCDEIEHHLEAGTNIDFKVKDSVVGTFTISDAPTGDATLLLAIHRHDDEGLSVAFASHIFADVSGAQVAVIDTYQGQARANIIIKDANRTELLRYDSVVAINPGHYRASMTNETVPTVDLVALPRERYVVLRCGVEAKEKGGRSYPQELFVFPHSDPSALGEASRMTRPLVATLTAWLALLLLKQ